MIWLWRICSIVMALLALGELALLASWLWSVWDEIPHPVRWSVAALGFGYGALVVWPWDER